jgi:hypothetical protein
MAKKVTNKDSLMATLIGGSNAAGKALPPTSISDNGNCSNRERLCSKVFAYMPQVIEQFGTESEWEWDCTSGLNTKGGVDDWEFELYIINLILSL